MAVDDVVELAFDKLLAYRRDMVDIELAYEMIILMLNDAGQKTRNLLVVRLEVLVLPFQAYVFDTGHVLRQSGQAKTSFRTGYALTVEHFKLRIDQHHLAADTFGEVLAQRRGVDDDESDIAAYLRRRLAYTFALVHAGLHIIDKFPKIGILTVDRLGDASEHRMAVKVNW